MKHFDASAPDVFMSIFAARMTKKQAENAAFAQRPSAGRIITETLILKGFVGL
ncbi:MAG: hypothetical protein ABSA83_22150 [Verrucomicrobiota bacterium]|jgi:hypothetical protein